MYRGEAAIHGLMDAAKLVEQLILCCHGQKIREQAIAEYEEKMRDRTHDAVLLSRQACLDAHDLRNLKDDSPVVSRRTKVLQPGTKLRSYGRADTQHACIISTL